MSSGEDKIRLKIKELETEYARTQKNKATEGHLGLLKAKLSKLRRELLGKIQDRLYINFTSFSNDCNILLQNRALRGRKAAEPANVVLKYPSLVTLASVL